MRASRDETRMRACCAAHIVGRGALCEGKPGRADTRRGSYPDPVSSPRIRWALPGARLGCGTVVPPCSWERTMRFMRRRPAPTASAPARPGGHPARRRSEPARMNLAGLAVLPSDDPHEAAAERVASQICAQPRRAPRPVASRRRPSYVGRHPPDVNARRAARRRRAELPRASLWLEFCRRARPHRRGRRAFRQAVRAEAFTVGATSPSRRVVTSQKQPRPRPARARTRPCLQQSAGRRSSRGRPSSNTKRRGIAIGRENCRTSPATAIGTRGSRPTASPRRWTWRRTFGCTWTPRSGTPCYPRSGKRDPSRRRLRGMSRSSSPSQTLSARLA